MNIPSADSLLKSIAAICTACAYQEITLGIIDGYPIVLLTPQRIRYDYPNILVAAGFHGDEIAGPLSIQRLMLHQRVKFPEEANVSFLPLVNPVGFTNHTRLGVGGFNPNSGHCRCDHEPSSAEGTILHQQLSVLIPLAGNGFISLHEDTDENRAYLYSFEKGRRPTAASRRLVETLACFFPIVGDSHLYGDPIDGGIIFNAHDGSFEDFLFHCGVPFTVCSETPGRLPLEKRINADIAILHSLVEITRTLR
jgi:hypothetical protein